ncbi:hypothetical protein [Bradyrhizobium sp. LA2.1]|uniref:hypothetical protein n=1 Tax=Bradyrhizobium sp. LA2.1 TaxID=3156376 RepID=UPI003395DF88
MFATTRDKIFQEAATATKYATGIIMDEGDKSNILYSINRAADLLEKDRATLVRALRGVAPDGMQGDWPRYTMRTITDALAMKPRERRAGAGLIRHSAVLSDLRRAIEKQLASIGVEKSPDIRRQMALALAPQVAGYQAAYLVAGRAIHVDADALGVRADLIVQEMLEEITEAVGCEDRGAFYAGMVAAMQAHGDGGEVV